MSELALRPVESCRFDMAALGEVMIRLDPGDERIATARTFTAREGGGEYNVARALQRTFGQRTALLSAIGDNEVAALLEDLLRQGGVNLDYLVRMASDDIGRHHRTPLNFTERGFGARAGVGVYDRAHSACSAIGADDFDFDALFGRDGVRWFHTGGIFASLSPSTLEVTKAAMAAARRFGTVVSYDINYRPSLWADRGGAAAAEAVTSELLEYVDVLFGVPEWPGTVAGQDASAVVIAASPQRDVHSASRQDWSGWAWSTSTGLIEGDRFDDVEVLDRVGSGDGFAAGVIYGLLNSQRLEAALRWGIAHGLLVMTTTGDTSAATIGEIERLVEGEAAEIRR